MGRPARAVGASVPACMGPQGGVNEVLVRGGLVPWNGSPRAKCRGSHREQSEAFAGAACGVRRGDIEAACGAPETWTERLDGLSIDPGGLIARCELPRPRRA